MRWNRLPVLAPLALLLLSSALTAQDLHLYEAVYTARAAGLSAQARRQLTQLEGDYYQLRQEMEVRVLGARLGSVEESSDFRLDGTVLQPESYRYRRSGVSSRNEGIEFNWAEGTALSSDEDGQWTLNLQQGVLDPLSFQLALRLQLADPAIQEVSLQMVDSDEIETHLYRVTGTEVIETGLGPLDTLKVERIRRPGSDRRTTFWLARDWHLLLVRFEQVDGSGGDTELSLDHAVIAGQQVMPLSAQ